MRFLASVHIQLALYYKCYSNIFISLPKNFYIHLYTFVLYFHFNEFSVVFCMPIRARLFAIATQWHSIRFRLQIRCPLLMETLPNEPRLSYSRNKMQKHRDIYFTLDMRPWIVVLSYIQRQKTPHDSIPLKTLRHFLQYAVRVCQKKAPRFKYQNSLKSSRFCKKKNLPI